MSVSLTVRESRTWYRSSAAVMGTIAEVVIDGDAGHVSKAFARMRALEACWTRFDDDSELNRLHRQAGRWVDVSDEMLSALRWCHRLSAETAGIFDPTIRRSLEESGYSRTFAHVLDDSTPLPPPAMAPGIGSIEIDRASGQRPTDAGRVGRSGWGRQGARRRHGRGRARSAGARAAFVSIGGDIHAAGEPPDESSWSVPLLHPLSHTLVATHVLRSGGLVMSSVAGRRWRRGTQDVHHIIDPRTGRSAVSDLVGVAVASHSAARGEALAKAAVVLGMDKGEQLLRAAGVGAWLIGPAGVQIIEEDPCSR